MSALRTPLDCINPLKTAHFCVSAHRLSLLRRSLGSPTAAIVRTSAWDTVAHRRSADAKAQDPRSTCVPKLQVYFAPLLSSAPCGHLYSDNLHSKCVRQGVLLCMKTRREWELSLGELHRHRWNRKAEVTEIETSIKAMYRRRQLSRIN